MSLLFSKIVFFLKNFVSLCLLRLIQSVFRSIEIVLNFFKEASVYFDQSKIVKQVFLKSEFDLFKLTFQKVFQTFLSLSELDMAHQQIFCRSPPKFLQGFPLSKPVSPLCPSFCILFNGFMHFFMHFIGYFQNFSNWGF